MPQELYIWRLPEVCRRTGYGHSTLYDLIRRGEFPAQIRLGRRAVGWDSRAVQAWIESRIAASSGGTQ